MAFKHSQKNEARDPGEIRRMFALLDDCVESAEAAKQTGNWTSAVAKLRQFNVAVDTYDIVDCFHAATQTIVAAQNCMAHNWGYMFVAIIAVIAIISGAHNRHQSHRPHL